MSQPVQRLSDIRRAELIRFYREMQRLQPDVAEAINVPGIIQALQTEDYWYLHRNVVFMQNDAFPEKVCTLDELPGTRPLLLRGFSFLTYQDWTDLPVANDPAFLGV